MNSNPTVFFTFTSEPGDYIGGGRSNHYDHTNTTFKARASEDGNSISISVERDFDNWHLNFAAPKGQRLQAGTYNRAIRYGFQPDHQPGFTMSGCGRGSNQSYGGFIVDAITFDDQGKLTSFHARFAQRSERVTAPTLLGELHYGEFPAEWSLPRPTRQIPTDALATVVVALLG